MITFEVYELEKAGTFGFLLIEDGTAIRLYDHDPDTPGEDMSAEVAEARAIAISYMLNNPVPDPGFEIVVHDENQQAPQQPKQTTMGPIEFMTRFSPEEQAALIVLKEKTHLAFEQAVSTDSVTEQLVELQGFFTMWDKASVIDVTYPPLVVGLMMVCSAIGMTPQRIKELLTV